MKSLNSEIIFPDLQPLPWAKNFMSPSLSCLICKDCHVIEAYPLLVVIRFYRAKLFLGIDKISKDAAAIPSFEHASRFQQWAILFH